MQRGRGGRRIDQCAEFALNAGSGLVIAIHVTISSDGTIMNQWNGMYHKVVNIRCLISFVIIIFTVLCFLPKQIPLLFFAILRILYSPRLFFRFRNVCSV